MNKLSSISGCRHLERALHMARGVISVDVFDQNTIADSQDSDADIVVVWFEGVSDPPLQTIMNLYFKKTQNLIVYLSEYDEVAEIISLRSGAADVLCSRMSASVIAERMIVAHKRSRKHVSSAAKVVADQRASKFGEFWLDGETNELWFKDIKLSLSPTEMLVLKTLVSHSPQIVGREELGLKLRSFHGRKVNLRTVDTVVSRIRQKVRENFDDITLIKSFYAQGYKIVVPVSFLKTR